MADLVTRLLLNSSNFDNNIRKSSWQVQQFQKVGQNITATLGKFAGAIGVAMTALEMLDRTIKGSQTTSDTYDLAMRALNVTIDTFFSAIGTGDFTAFNMGLSSMIEKAVEALKAIDKLGNATMSYSYFDTKYSAELEDAINKAKDLRLSQAERDLARKTAEAIIGKQEEITKELSKSINNALSNVMTEGNALKASLVSKVDLEDVLLLDITAKGEENKKKLELQYKEYMQIYNKVVKKHTVTTTMNTSAGAFTQSSTDTAKVNTEMLQYNLQYKQAILYNEILVKKGDEWLQLTIQMAQQLDKSNRKLTEMKNKTLELTNKEVNRSITTNVQKDVPVGSLAELDKQIAAKKTELGLAISGEDRIRINKELEALTEKKRVIEFQYKYPNAPSGELPRTSLALKMPDMKGVKIQSPIKKKDVLTNEDYLESLNAITNVMGVMANMTNEGAAAWLNWAGSLMSATATAIEAIHKVVTAKTAEAAASGAAEAAKTPFVGWLMVGGAIASVLAAFAALPKFASGGIVGGNSTIADMNLIRVNAGEMVLNNRLQRNLFNLLNSNGTIAGTGNGLVTFKIQGKELVGVLNNYNNQKNKVR